MSTGFVRVSWGPEADGGTHYVVVEPVDRTITEAFDKAKHTLTAMMANTLASNQTAICAQRELRR